VRDYLHVMDLAKGHVLSLDALAKPTSEGIFKSTDTSKSGYYRAFNLGKGKGMSVLDMINAMKQASGFDFKYEIVGRRYVFLMYKRGRS
jgi:UDP-glucose 4-epimerase